MTETINKYNNGKIYKIISYSNPDLVYYGSTIQPLSKRMDAHRNSKGRYKSEQIIELGDAKILLVENYSCNSKEELIRKESEYILNNNCVNKVVPGRTRKEWSEANKDLIKQNSKEYYEANKEVIKEYREANRDVINQKQKARREANRDVINQKQKARREANRDVINQKNKARREANRDVINQKNKEYRLKNKDSYNQKKREYRLKKKLEKLELEKNLV